MQTQITEIYKWGRIVLIVLAVFLGVFTLNGLKGLRNPNPVYNVITVNGEGEAIGVPDVASFTYSVSEDAESVGEAQELVTTKMDKVIGALKNLGIEERDIKTIDYSVYPKYRYEALACTPGYCPPGRQIPDGYTATHSVMVKVRETTKAGEALSAAGTAGATNMSSLSFAVDDTDALLNEARAEAINDAKEKAKMLADELGVRLVRVMGYNDNLGGGPMPYYREVGMGGAMDVTQAKAPTLPTGENKYTISVSVTYEIR
jgi:uncharacterized protein